PSSGLLGGQILAFPSWPLVPLVPAFLETFSTPLPFPPSPLLSTWNSNKQWAWAWYHWYQASPPMTRRGPIPGPHRPLALFLNRHGGESHPPYVGVQW